MTSTFDYYFVKHMIFQLALGIYNVLQRNIQSNTSIKFNISQAKYFNKLNWNAGMVSMFCTQLLYYNLLDVECQELF